MKLSALLLVACFAGTAFAEPEVDEDRPAAHRARVPLTMLEQLSLIIPPMAYYWSTTDVQAVDFDMDWDWGSWKRKLTSADAYILDTNDWESNATRHPLAGYLAYQIGRANGFAPLGSVGMALGTSALWEYLVEYKELISVNDLVVNTGSAFAIGEPLFQLGRLADERGARWTRQGLGLLTSPYHRVHAWHGYSSWGPRGPRWAQLEAALGAATGSHDEGTWSDARVALDLELVTDRRYGRPGSSVARFGPGSWNRVVADVRVAADAPSTFRFATQTTFAGRYTREIDDTGSGTDWFLGTATGADYLSQRLASEWDSTFVMHLLGPRLALGHWRDGYRVTWELAGYADLGMTDAHVFGPEPAFPPEPLFNVLQVRGYYYAAGLSIATRLRADTPRWTAELEGRAFQLWSIDGLDRVEMNGSDLDPHDVSDQRAFARGALGARVSRELRLELAIEAALRRGTWQQRERVTTELASTASLIMPF